MVKVWLRLRGSPLRKIELTRVARVNVSRNVSVLMARRLAVETSRSTPRILPNDTSSILRAHYVGVKKLTVWPDNPFFCVHNSKIAH